jgi:hypothetical protein
MLPEQAFSPRLGRGFGGGGMTLEGGKGGGGGAPVQQTVANTSIPEYARPYVENMLGKTEALTDINQNPYQTYQGQRIAEFSPLQQQAFGNTANMQVAPQVGQASGLAGMSGLGALGAGRQYAQQATNPYATQAYMSPYMQNAVNVQKQEALRDAQKNNIGMNLASARQGTYGGARQLLGEQERNRNLQTQLGNIQATGTQNAFQAAQQAQQFGAGLGLQGYGQAGQAAATLGQLGQNQYGQQMGINQAQQQVGAIQQAQAQQGLDTAYQDFLKQKNYPYQQLAFMSDMARGLPLSQTSQAMYAAPPNAASQLGGLGMSALGIYGMSGGFKAKGGMVGEGHANGGLMAAKAYKDGGLAYSGGGKISSMTTQQLTAMLRNPSTDQFLAAEVEKELMLRRRMAMNPESDEIMAPAMGRSGIASIGTGEMVPEGMAAGAGGGIVAFKTGDVVNLKKPSSAEAFDERIRSMEEREAAAYKNLFENSNSFEKSKAAEEDIRKEIASSKEMAPWQALTYAGLGAMQGNPDPVLRQNFLSNLAYGAEKGLGAYGKSAEEQGRLNKLLLTQGVEQEKAKYGRDVSNLNALQTSIGQAYNRKIAQSAAGAGSEDRAINRAQLLINSDPLIKKYIAQQKMLGETDPQYQVIEQRIAERQNQIFSTAGVKVPEITTSKIPDYVAPEKTAWYSNIFGGSKPEAKKSSGVMKFDKNGNPV